MKTIIHNENKLSKYLFEDNVAITVTDKIIFTPIFNIADMNSTNSILVENVTPPEDWAGCKYFYNEGAWTLNPNWVDPETI